MTTTFYVDAAAGLDANDGLTPEKARRTLEGLPTHDAHTFLRRGGAYPVTEPMSAQYGSMQAYGADGASPVLSNPSGNGGMILNWSGGGSDGAVLRDLDFDCSGGGIYLSGQGKFSQRNGLIQRCRFYGSKVDGLALLQEDDATGSCSGFHLDACDSFLNAGHGFLFTGVGHTISRCRAWNNGAGDDYPYGGHNFSARYTRSVAGAEWAQIGDGVWAYFLPANQTAVDFLRVMDSSLDVMKRNVVGGAPAIGQFSVDGRVLYANFGRSDPNVALLGKIVYAWGATRDLLFTRCESWGARLNPITPYPEGIGLALDDFTSDSTVHECVLRDNDGPALSINGGVGNDIIRTVASGNGGAGIGDVGPFNRTIACVETNNSRGEAAKARPRPS